MENFLCGANVLVDICNIFSEEFKFEKIGVIAEDNYYLNSFIKKVGQSNKIETDKEKIKDNSIKALVFLGDHILFNKINKEILNKPVFFIFDSVTSFCKSDYAEASVVKVIYYPYILQNFNKEKEKTFSYIFSFLGVCESIDFNSIMQYADYSAIKLKNSILNIIKFIKNNEINGATIDGFIKLIFAFNAEKYPAVKHCTNLAVLVNLIYSSKENNEIDAEFIMAYLISKLNLEFLLKANFATIQSESFYKKFYFQKKQFPEIFNENELIASYYSYLKNTEIKNELVLKYNKILNNSYKYFALNKLALKVYKKIILKTKSNTEPINAKSFIQAVGLGVDFSSFNLSVIMRNFGFFGSND